MLAFSGFNVRDGGRRGAVDLVALPIEFGTFLFLKMKAVVF